MPGEGRYADEIEVVYVIPDVILGAKPADKKFQVFSKAVLEAYIDARVKARKNGITLTGITGNVITHEDFVGEKILSIMIDDVPFNTKFTKGNENHIDSDQVILGGGFELTALMTITFFFE